MHRFITHGMPSLLEEPIPALVREIASDPYSNPKNPPQDPDKMIGFCGMQWASKTDPATGLKKYRLKDFQSEQEAISAGFLITHQGHCGGTPY